MVVGACTCARRSVATGTEARCPTWRWRRTSATPSRGCRALRSSIGSGALTRSIVTRWRGWCARSAGSLTRLTRSRRPVAGRSACWTRARWAHACSRTGCGSASGSGRRSSPPAAGASWTRARSSARSSRWSQTACQSSRCPSSPAATGLLTGRSWKACPGSARTRATARWTPARDPSGAAGAGVLQRREPVGPRGRPAVL